MAQGQRVHGQLGQWPLPFGPKPVTIKYKVIRVKRKVVLLRC